MVLYHWHRFCTVLIKICEHETKGSYLFQQEQGIEDFGKPAEGRP